MQKQTARTQESGHLLVPSVTTYLFLQVRSTYLSGQRVVSDLRMPRLLEMELTMARPYFYSSHWALALSDIYLHIILPR